MFNLVLGLLLPIYPLVTLRGKAREKNQIEVGSEASFKSSIRVLYFFQF